MKSLTDCQTDGLTNPFEIAVPQLKNERLCFSRALTNRSQSGPLSFLKCTPTNFDDVEFIFHSIMASDDEEEKTKWSRLITPFSIFPIKTL